MIFKDMEVEMIKKLLDQYYSGEISPLDYDMLRSASETADEFPPEIRKELVIFRTIESSDIAVPDDLEERLIHSIDRKANVNRSWVKVFYSGVAAAVAVVVLCVTVINKFSGLREPAPDFIAERVASEPDSAIWLLEAETDTLTEMISDEELEIRINTVNNALRNVLSGISNQSRNTVERVNEIRIKQDINDINKNLSK